MNGTKAGERVKILKDDGCNANIFSRSFMREHRPLLDIQPSSSVVQPSNNNRVEQAQEIIVDTQIQIGAHRYRSNWIVEECRYDVLLGMLCYVLCCPIVDYNTGKLKNKGVELPPSQDSGRSVTV